MTPAATMSDSDKQGFDIVATYHRLLAEDPDLTMPVAAIESLVELLAQSQASTISETLDLLETSTKHLKAAIANPISLSAGTDLFQRYLISTLTRPLSRGHAPGALGDFRGIRAHLLSNGRLFVSRAKASRDKIASFGKHFVRDGTTVLTNGGSRVVGALLRQAAEGSKGSVRFRVIYVLPTTNKSTSRSEGEGVVASLREKGVPVAVIPESAVAYSMGKVDMIIVGAEGVVENGGIISRLGTYQMGILAKAASKPFYVVAESHKFVRLYPLNQYDLPIDQKVIDFATSQEDGLTEVDSKKSEHVSESGSLSNTEAVDFTPPDLISALITEGGVLTPSASASYDMWNMTFQCMLRGGGLSSLSIFGTTFEAHPSRLNFRESNIFSFMSHLFREIHHRLSSDSTDPLYNQKCIPWMQSEADSGQSGFIGLPKQPMDIAETQVQLEFWLDRVLVPRLGNCRSSKEQLMEIGLVWI